MAGRLSSHTPGDKLKKFLKVCITVKWKMLVYHLLEKNKVTAAHVLLHAFIHVQKHDLTIKLINNFFNFEKLII